jgi:hypothetical protein
MPLASTSSWHAPGLGQLGCHMMLTENRQSNERLLVLLKQRPEAWAVAERIVERVQP